MENCALRSLMFRAYSMIRKSAKRFSEKTMLKQTDRSGRSPGNASSPRRDRKQRRAVRLRGHHADRHHRRLVDEADTERADQLCQRQHRLDQREMRADADPRADAERQIGKTV